MYCKKCKNDLDESKFYKSNKKICIECLNKIRLNKRNEKQSNSINQLLLEGYTNLEEYKDYYINNVGKIFRVFSGGSINEITGFVTKNGYKMCTLYHDRPQYMHRLVAKTFIPNPNNLPCVNHKDGNKLNNNVENLEWCTYSDNEKHAYMTNLKGKGEEAYNAKLTERQVLDIRAQKGVKNSYELADMYNVSRGCIQQVLSNRTWKHLYKDRLDNEDLDECYKEI